MAFSESFLTELVERNDIVDVVSGYVRLSKKSGSNMFGLCPFHSEKTPSFSPAARVCRCLRRKTTRRARSARACWR